MIPINIAEERRQTRKVIYLDLSVVVEGIVYGRQILGANAISNKIMEGRLRIYSIPVEMPSPNWENFDYLLWCC